MTVHHQSAGNGTAAPGSAATSLLAPLALSSRRVRANFMAGVRLFDEALDAAASHCRSPGGDYFLDASLRDGAPLNVYLIEHISRLIQHPEYAAGLAAALGEYAAVLQDGLVPGGGAQSQYLTIRKIIGGSHA